MFGRLFKKEKTSRDAQIRIRTDEGVITLGNAQHCGKRDYQEDSFGFSDMSDEVVRVKGILAVLADGMGGLKNGRAVSTMAVSSLLEWFNQESTVCDSAMDLKNAVSVLNDRICNEFCPDGRIESGTTIIAAMINHGFLHWLCVGDSRLYIKRNERLYQINEDHDYLNQLLDEVIDGYEDLSKAFADSQKDRLTRCIGKRELDSYDYSKNGYRLRDGDTIILCSDGVYNALSQEEINRSITNNAMESCKNIIRLVAGKKLPHQDNNTIVIMSYNEER